MRAKTYPHTCHHPKKDIRKKKRICNLRTVLCWLVKRERANETRRKLEREGCVLSSAIRYKHAPPRARQSLGSASSV